MTRRAADKLDLTLGLGILHRDCGGAVEHETFWRCNKCQQRWSTDTVANFSPQDLADRFYVEARRGWWDGEPDAFALVEVEEDGRRFTRTVPASEAHKYTKAKPGV